MPPITGFYRDPFNSVTQRVMFALLGSNPQMSVGADSTIAPLFAIGIATPAWRRPSRRTTWSWSESLR